MADEAVFVAIGIACVVAVLLFVVFIIYCVKKQQDKEQTRQMRERRAREERQRRHLMRAHVVRPPPYDPNRQNIITSDRQLLPLSPPPAYKEVATPLPRNRDDTGIGGVAFAPDIYGNGREDDIIPTVSRNVAPINTIFSSSNNSIRHSHFHTGNSRDTNGNNSSRLAADSYYTRMPHDVTLQVQPYSVVASDTVLPAASSHSPGRTIVARRENGQTMVGDRLGTYGTRNAIFKAQNHERVSFDNLTVRGDDVNGGTARQPYLYPSHEGGARTQSYFTSVGNSIESSQPNLLPRHTVHDNNTNTRRSSQTDHEQTDQWSEAQPSSYSTLSERREFARPLALDNRRFDHYAVVSTHPTPNLEDLSLI